MIWIPLLQLLLGLVIGSLALLQYRKNSERDRTRWLFDLSSKFYGTDDFQEINNALDDMERDLERKIRSVIEGTPTPENTVEQQLTRYLNFFELVAQLWRRGQLSDEDVKDVFDYPLGRLKRLPMSKYLKDSGYEALPKLLWGTTCEPTA